MSDFIYIYLYIIIYVYYLYFMCMHKMCSAAIVKSHSDLMKPNKFPTSSFRMDFVHRQTVCDACILSIVRIDDNHFSQWVHILCSQTYVNRDFIHFSCSIECVCVRLIATDEATVMRSIWYTCSSSGINHLNYHMKASWQKNRTKRR